MVVINLRTVHLYKSHYCVLEQLIASPSLYTVHLARLSNYLKAVTVCGYGVGTSCTATVSLISSSKALFSTPCCHMYSTGIPPAALMVALFD